MKIALVRVDRGSFVGALADRVAACRGAWNGAPCTFLELWVFGRVFTWAVHRA